jgi:two-component system, NtrC family, response regulator HydG
MPMKGPHRREATVIMNSGPAPSTGRGWLLVRPGTPTERRYDIEQAPLVIGTDEECDVRLSDQYVSHRHAEVHRTAAGVVLRDLESSNGTFVEEIAVKEAVLPGGARLRVGKTAMAFETDDEAGRLARMIHSDLDDEALANIPPEFAPVVGASPAMRRICALLAQLAPTDLTITLLGETGTGKDVLARAVHARSQRAEAPFVVFDSGAVAPTLIESELFGHKKGAFTGAVAERHGAFERARGGTLFLDEIGELSLDLQPKLLRALEQRTVQPVGGTEDVAVDVRIIAATNRDLEAHVREGKFREDLFFRLSTALVTVPPLRERQQDLVELARRFLAEAGKPLDISPEARAILEGHDWPGNVRELKNVVTSAAALAGGSALEPKHMVFFKPRRRSPDVDALPLAGQSLEAIERAAIEQTLHRFNGNKSKAARALGIAASTLYEKIRKYRPRRKTRA